jgi:hypothetical protein
MTMRARGVWAFLFLTLGVSVLLAADDAPKRGATVNHKLIGTWKVVSAKYGGEVSKRPEGFTQLKHVTPVQFMWAIYDKDGKVVAALGGPCTLTEKEYVEIPEYGVGSFEELKGKPQVFTWKIEGNKWYHTGKLSSGLTIEEVWERVEKK